MSDALILAILTALSTTAIAEGVRAVWRYIDRRGRSADWSIRAQGAVPGGGHFYVIENIGDADALDVHIAVSGDAEYHVNAGAPIDMLRPRDTILMLVVKPGTGSVVIDWKDRKGKDRGPARRALTPK